VRGFLSFLVDAIVSQECLVCGRGIGPFHVVGGAGPRLDPGLRMSEFLAADLRLEVGAGISVSARVLCPDCWLRLERAPCAGRLERPGAPVTSVPLVAPFFTNDELLALVRFFKFSGGRAAAPPLGWWMARALRDHLEHALARGALDPVLIPVPLHPAREKSRGYNQASLLAWEVAERLGLDVDCRILKRTRNTKCQSMLDSSERSENVKGAFAIVGAHLVNGKNIVLVDDLVTTGETVGAAIAALEQALPSSVAVLSAGRVRD